MVHMKTNQVSVSLWNVKGLYGEDWQKGPILPLDWFFRVKSNRSYEFLDENNTNARQHIVNKLDQEVVNNFDQFIIKRSGSKRKPTSKGKVAKHQFLNQMFSIAQE